MIRFEDILDKVESYKPDFDQALLEKAYIFSAREHKGQVRSSGDPYLVHPINVAHILAEMRLDETSIAVGLLHDVLEDTLTTKERLQETFGDEIAEIVDGVTKISRYAFVSKEEQQAETFRKMLLAMVSDLRVVLVKLADRLHNMRTLQHLPEGRWEPIAKETMEIYAPIANRLGMGRIKNELEDLSFRYLMPTQFADLSAAVKEKVAVSGEVVERIRGVLSEKLTDNELRGEVNGRVKSMYSIHQKLLRQGIDIGQVYDYLAFRIITEDVKDCYAALGIIHQKWRPVPGRIKDYIAMPKPNFYQSLHTTVLAERGQPFEVQIRTREMDLVAEQGIAAHWKYKEGRLGGDAGKEGNLLWLRQLVEWQHEIKDPRVFMNSLKIDLYPDEVYTFTPKGDVFAFPRGATPLDFAYRIHTDVGHKCVGARVNGKLTPLRTQLKNGDIVQILTGTNQTPSREWLNLVTTSRARHKIRHWLNTEQKDRSIEVGRKLLEREARRYKVQIKKLIAQNALDGVLSEYGFARIDDLYADIGYGKVAPKAILERFVPENEKARPEEPPNVLQQAVRKIFPFTSPQAIKVRGYDDLMTYLAKCCNPLPGEEIMGYVTRGKGVAVHSANCPNVKNLMFNSDREITVEWADQASRQHQIELEIVIEDRQGMLARVVSSVASLKTNIRHIETRTVEDQAIIDLVLEVSNLRQLERVIRSIDGVEGVVRTQRKYNIHHATA